MKEFYDDPEELAEELIGTCSMADPSELLGDDEAKIAKFDSLAFECEECGWWFSTDDLNNNDGDLKCTECAPLEDD